MKHTLHIILFTAATALAAPATHAIDLGGLFGNNNAQEQTQPQSAQDMLGNAARGQIDSVAGKGTADVLTGQSNPMIGMILNQLGIPTEYAPQIQALYKNFTSDGNVTATEVNNQEGLSGWLGTQPTMDAAGLANSLTSLFTKTQ